MKLFINKNVKIEMYDNGSVYTVNKIVDDALITSEDFALERDATVMFNKMVKEAM